MATNADAAAGPPRLRRLLPPVLLLAAVLALVPLGGMLRSDGLAARLLEALAWAAGAFLVVRLLDVLVWHGLAVRHGGRPPPRLLVDLAAALVWIVAACAAAGSALDLPVAGVVTTSGVAVAVLGFALRDVLTSLCAGLALNAERPYQIGDWVEVEPFPAARVVEIGWLTTRAVTRDGVGVVLPNAQLARQPFRNYSRPEPSFRECFAVTLDHEASPDRVERLLLAAASEVPEVEPPLQPRQPDVKIAEFGPRGVVWQLRFWLADYAALPEIRYRLQRAVLRHLNQAGLSPAYAKLDLFHAEMPPRNLEPGRADEALLARCEIFHALDPADLARLAAAARRRRLSPGEVLLREGDPGGSLFVVIEGVLEVWRERPGTGAGGRQRLNTVGAGGTLGEFALLTGERRSATVAATCDALLLEIERDALAPILERRPDLAEALGRILAERQARAAALALEAAPALDAAVPADEHGIGQRIRAFFGL